MSLSTSRIIKLVVNNKEDIFDPNEIPGWARDLMEEGYKEAARPSDEQSYQCTGCIVYHFQANGYLFISDQCVDGYIKTKGIDKAQTKVGDFGAGDNSLIKTLNLRDIPGIGLSATDYSDSKRHGEEKDLAHPANYVVANGEFLSSVPSFTNLDIIFVKMTFRHIRNVAKVLIDLYRAAKPGAIIVIDELCFPGMDGWHRDLVGYLRKEGYEITTTYNYYCSSSPFRLGLEKLKCVCIAKTKPDLLLPLHYDRAVKNEIDNLCVGYRPSQLLVNYRKQKEVAAEIKGEEIECKSRSDSFVSLNMLERDDRYILDLDDRSEDDKWELGSERSHSPDPVEFSDDEDFPKVIEDIAAKLSSPSKSKKDVDQSLIDLFKDPRYSTMEPEQQAREIKSIVSRMTRKEEVENLNYLKSELVKDIPSPASRAEVMKYLFDVTANDLPSCKLAVYVKLHNFFSDSREHALAQIKFLALLEIEAEREVIIQEDFFQKHFGFKPQKQHALFESYQVQIMPDRLICQYPSEAAKPGKEISDKEPEKYSFIQKKLEGNPDQAHEHIFIEPKSPR